MKVKTLPVTTWSLANKLILSYLVVILGIILVLGVAVSAAVQSYIDQEHFQNLESSAAAINQTLRRDYQINNESWNNIPSVQLSDPTALLVIFDANGKQILCSAPDFVDACNNNTDINTALTQALQAHQPADVHIDVSNTSLPAVSMPIHYYGPHIIGSFLVAQPLVSNPAIFSRINTTIFLCGLVVAVIAVLFSLFFTHRLTRPLRALTRAAELMKRGRYTQRVEVPRNLDEIGMLAQTFNEMANTIEADINELREQDQMRRDLIANIAHDLATPLTAIQGFSEALADEVITDAEVRQETVQRISREVQRLRRMVGDVRQMSSMESGQAPLDLAELDLHFLVDETLAVIEPECDQAEISLRNEILPETPTVQADSDRITQVLLNLLDNARRHTPAGGCIAVGASPNGAMLDIWVSDSGSGIDAKDLPHIFERFYRADRSRTIATGGSGLGLAIVRAIITAHGGTIRAESSPGQGTCITFSLPLAHAHNTASIPTVHA